MKMMSDAYYADTYALIEIGKGSQQYQRYKENIKLVLHKLNIVELCYFMLREKRENEMKAWYAQLSKFHSDPPDEVYLETAKMKYKYKERRLSYIDCLGYCMARYLKIKFLTGDEKFRDLPGVEFVK